MNYRQRAKIERFLRLKFQLQLDNILFALNESVREGRPLKSADLILLNSSLQRLRSAGMEVLGVLDVEQGTMDLNSRELRENLELAG